MSRASVIKKKSYVTLTTRANPIKLSHLCKLDRFSAMGKKCTDMKRSILKKNEEIDPKKFYSFGSTFNHQNTLI
jgi:hypothetical protein